MMPAQTCHEERIMVIRLGALGDLVKCFEAFQKIRHAHPGAKIALLTMPAYQDFAQSMPWFDEVILDTRPKLTNIKGWLGLLSRIKKFAPTKVYDLQCKMRQNILFYFMGGFLWGPKWSGAAPWCHFPRPWPPDASKHFTESVGDQLRVAGLDAEGIPDLRWLDADVTSFGLDMPYMILIPSCSPEHKHKLWPAGKYADLGKNFIEKGLAVVTVGGKSDKQVCIEVKKKLPQSIDLSGKTTPLQLAGLLRGAVCVVGNDTGPTHLSAALGVPTLALFSGKVNAVWCAPKGSACAYVQSDNLKDLPVSQVLHALMGHY